MLQDEQRHLIVVDKQFTQYLLHLQLTKIITTIKKQEVIIKNLDYLI
jgi:hypothetical protein